MTSSQHTPPLTSEEFRLLTSPHEQKLESMIISSYKLEKMCPLDNGRHEIHEEIESRPFKKGLALKFHQRSQQGISPGMLETLPLEILQMILGYLDLKSLTELRTISRRVRTFVDNLSFYSLIFQHAPNSVRALLSTSVAQYFTIKDLFQALCSKYCFSCGAFGPFLQLLSCRRCCLNCVIDKPELMGMEFARAKEYFGLTDENLMSMPKLLSIPGNYSECHRKYPNRVLIVDWTMVLSIAAEHHGGMESLREFVNTHSRERNVARSAPSIYHWYSAQRAGQPDPLNRPLDGNGLNPHRFMGIIRFPTLDLETGTSDLGVACQACRFDATPFRGSLSTYKECAFYTLSGYEKHFDECNLAKRLRTELPPDLSNEKRQSKLDGAISRLIRVGVQPLLI